MNVESAITQYFNEINTSEYDAIDNEEIKKLVKIAQDGYDEEKDEWTEAALEARNEVVKRNIRLVPYVIHKVMKDNKMNLFMDCVNECHFAVIKCIIGYDLEGGTNFATYAQVSIYRHAWRFLRENASSIKLPAQKVAERKKIEDEIYRTPGVLNRLFKRDFKPLNPVYSLDYQFDDGSRVHTSPFKDIPTHESVPEKIYTLEMSDLIIESLECLTDKEKLIIEKRYLNDDKRTLRDIADDIGMSGERVRQIEQKALLKLRSFLRYSKKEDR